MQSKLILDQDGEPVVSPSRVSPTVCSLGPMVKGREDPTFWVIRSHPKHISSILCVGIDFFPQLCLKFVYSHTSEFIIV